MRHGLLAGGRLELLSAGPAAAQLESSTCMPPVLFLHGAFHSAAAWEDTACPAPTPFAPWSTQRALLNAVGEISLC